MCLLFQFWKPSSSLIPLPDLWPGRGLWRQSWQQGEYPLVWRVVSTIPQAAPESGQQCWDSNYIHNLGRSDSAISNKVLPFTETECPQSKAKLPPASVPLPHIFQSSRAWQHDCQSTPLDAGGGDPGFSRTEAAMRLAANRASTVIGHNQAVICVKRSCKAPQTTSPGRQTNDIVLIEGVELSATSPSRLRHSHRNPHRWGPPASTQSTPP